MAPRAPRLPAASSSRHTHAPGPSTQTEGIQNPPNTDPLSPVAVSIRDDTSVTPIPPPRGSDGRSSTSSGRHRQGQSQRSRIDRLEEIAETQSREFAELRTLLLQQLRRPEPRTDTRPAPPPASGKRPVRNRYELEPEDLLDSVEGADNPPDFTRPSAVPSHPGYSWKPRVDHPRELDDGVEPTWITWKLNMEHKFDEDAPQFTTEKTRIHYMFSRTKGKASRFMEPFMSADSPVPFTTVEEVYAALEELLTNPGEVEQAKELFRDLQMGRTQSFAEFKMDFLQLAGLAEIPRASYVDELYNRLTDKLKEMLALKKYDWGDDFALAAKQIQQTDVRFTLNAKQRLRARALATLRTIPPDVTPSGSNKAVWKPDFSDLPRPSTMLRASSRPWTAEPVDRTKPVPNRPTDRNTTPYSGSDPQVKCYGCGRRGHVQRNCDQPAQPGTIQEITEEELLDESDLEDTPVDALLGKEHA